MKHTQREETKSHQTLLQIYPLPSVRTKVTPGKHHLHSNQNGTLTTDRSEKKTKLKGLASQWPPGKQNQRGKSIIKQTKPLGKEPN